MKNEKQYNLVWLRRDLRLDDHAAIYYALQSNLPLIFYFNFDTDILNQLENRSDSRVNFIHKQLTILNDQLHRLGSSLLVKTRPSVDCMEEIVSELNVANIYACTDYEPFAISRDQTIKELCASKEIEFQLVKDQVIFEKKEIVKKDGTPYTIYTPYMKKWMEKYTLSPTLSFKYQLKSHRLAQIDFSPIPSLKEIGFTESSIEIPDINLSNEMLENYNEKRNFPAMNATSNLGIHLRFGTVSIRKTVERAKVGHPQFLKELIWREFFMQILANFPHVENQCFKAKYEGINWINNEEDFIRWQNGKTGYPIVDAGMRELKATGSMHNRVRMIVASFLCKHLLIDWRWGEAYFANHLLDYDLAANNGNWQWVAGCGCDAAPYFRVFNPTEQQKKFDPDMEYIRRWIPEIDSSRYPKPMIDHKFARERALSTYKIALDQYK